MAENIKIVTWEIKNGKRNFLFKEIPAQDFKIAQIIVDRFEENCRKDVQMKLHDWVEYFYCKAIINGCICYNDEAAKLMDAIQEDASKDN